MLELVKDAEAFAAEIGTELTTLWDEFKAFVRNKPVEEAERVAVGTGDASPVAAGEVNPEAAPATEPVAEAAPPVVS